MRTRLAAAALLLLSACATTKRATPVLAPLHGQGEVHVYTQPFPREADRLAFTVQSVAAKRTDGTEVPLVVAQPSLGGPEFRDQKLFASGRLPPSEYTGLLIRTASATLEREGERAALQVEPEPATVNQGFTVGDGGSVVMWITLRPRESVKGEVGFSPSFSALIAPQTPPQVALYVTNTAEASVTVADRHPRVVSGVIPVGEAPRGIVVNRLATRAYIALGGEDQIDILDLAADRSIGRIRLSPGDSPGDLGLAADGTLLVVNERSRSVAFVDPVGGTELGRVAVGDFPTAMALDRSGRRAYVTMRASGQIAVIDIAHRSVAASIPTDPEPLRPQFSRDGTRLYVAHRGSGYMSVFRLPSLAQESRAYVALGATTIKVDARSDLIYVSRGDERRVVVYDPLSLQPVDQFEVPGAVSYMAIDDAENTLLALMPDRQAIAVVDLTSRRVVAQIPVGPDPYIMAFYGERY